MKITVEPGHKSVPVPLLLALIFAASGTLARAQNPAPANNGLNPGADRMVCPLSDTQTSSSIAAFAKVASAFTLEEKGRCGNCHGGVNPFVDENTGHHAGGAQNPAANQRGACQECHSGLPGWDVPFPDMFFMDGYKAPRKASVICRQIRRTFVKAQGFLDHIAKNTDLADFNGTAFLGTRGLNKLGQIFAYNQPYQAEPPDISRGEMVQRVRTWVGAMGGEFKGDASCGCEPVHVAVRIIYMANIEIGGVVKQVSQMGPVDIPITFHDDGTYDGNGTLPFAGAGAVRVGAAGCAAGSEGGMQIKVSGNAMEEWQNNHMHIELTNTSRTAGTTVEKCTFPFPPGFSGVTALTGGDKMSFAFDVRGLIGDSGIARVPLPAPTNAIVHVEVVEGGAQPASPQ